MLSGSVVKGHSDLEKFQRWLQSELAEASILEDPDERERRLVQIEIAIAEVIRFNKLLDGVENAVAAPFVQREEPVRSPGNSEIKPTVITGECHKCGASRSSDLEFCPVCGEF